MPALSIHAALMELDRREWKQTVGQSGMTPTAFAFLIPVFVVVVFCPFLCVFCIRKRQRTIPPPVKPAKKPALRRVEARERLRQLTEVSDVTDAEKATQNGPMIEEREQAQTTAESSSILERECAICLSTLHASSPPEPVLLQTQSPADEAAIRSPNANATINSDSSALEAILKLQICGHEFHAECLVSWFVLRKTTCPICRAAYISKEDMKVYEDEEAAELAPPDTTTPALPVTTTHGARRDANGVPISNWRYFWRGESWHRNRDTERGIVTGNLQMQSGTARNGDAMGQDDALEMARWSYFARTRR